MPQQSEILKQVKPQISAAITQHAQLIAYANGALDALEKFAAEFDKLSDGREFADITDVCDIISKMRGEVTTGREKFTHRLEKLKKLHKVMGTATDQRVVVAQPEDLKRLIRR